MSLVIEARPTPRFSTSHFMTVVLILSPSLQLSVYLPWKVSGLVDRPVVPWDEIEPLVSRSSVSETEHQTPHAGAQALQSVTVLLVNTG